MTNLVNTKEDEFDLVRMVESAYLKVFEQNKSIPKISEIKDEISYGYYDIIYGYEAVSVVSHDFISALLMSRNHIHKNRGDIYCDSQILLVPELCTDEYSDRSEIIALQ